MERGRYVVIRYSDVWGKGIKECMVSMVIFFPVKMNICYVVFGIWIFFLPSNSNIDVFFFSHSFFIPIIYRV